MKKNMRLLITGLLLCALLVACGHQHTWLAATCSAPKTCAHCGATEGTTTDHNWNDATCKAPKTCADCGATEGTTANHSWNDATCKAPKTCAECGTTEGSTLAHKYGQWSAKKQDASGKWIRSRSCALCGDQQTEETDAPNIRTDLGSAGSPDGTTVIVSIFANELNTSWDFETEADRTTRTLMLNHMKSATSWLTKQLGAYGAESHFIYDWEANPDLCYTYDFGQLMLVRTDGGGYWKQENYVLDNIPTEDLMEKYHAQNILYMFYFNTDESNTVNSWTLSDRQDVETEIINVFVRDNLSDGFYYMPASSLAHEIMHCFGAYDLYYASDAIPQAYVDHCKATGSRDIMYTVSLGDTIPQLFTRLDAYYLGLVDSCDEVTTWGLGKSSHLK